MLHDDRPISHHHLLIRATFPKTTNPSKENPILLRLTALFGFGLSHGIFEFVMGKPSSPEGQIHTVYKYTCNTQYVCTVNIKMYICINLA